MRSSKACTSVSSGSGGATWVGAPPPSTSATSRRRVPSPRCSSCRSPHRARPPLQMLSHSTRGSRSAARTSARGSGVRLVVAFDAVPLAPGATVADLGFGEDFELLAAVEDSLGSPVVGRVEAGDGVETLLRGEPYALSGWQHFF